jgi:hypothetical protein
MGVTVSLPVDPHVLAILGYFSIHRPEELETLLQQIKKMLLEAIVNIKEFSMGSSNHSPPYSKLPCFVCFVLMQRFNGAPKEQVPEYARLLLTNISNMYELLQLLGSMPEKEGDEPEPEPEPVVDQHPDWKHGPEKESPLVRTSTPLPPPPSMVHTMAEYGTIKMPFLPLPTALLRTAILDQLGRSALCQQVRKLLGLPETMGNKDVGIFVLLLWEFLLRHGLHGPLDMRIITLHTAIMPLGNLLNLAPVDKGALLVLQCLFAQVLSVLGYEPNPDEEDDVESLAPRCSLFSSPGDINICVEQLLTVLQQPVQGSA